MPGFNRPLRVVESGDDAVIVVPFCFTINGTSNPDAVLGDEILNRLVTRTSAGLFTFTLNHYPYAVIGGGCTMTSGATEDITPHLDASLASTTGVVTVRTMTTTTATDPADNNIVYGHILCTKTDRRAGGP